MVMWVESLCSQHDFRKGILYDVYARAIVFFFCGDYWQSENIVGVVYRLYEPLRCIVHFGIALRFRTMSLLHRAIIKRNFVEWKRV